MSMYLLKFGHWRSEHFPCLEIQTKNQRTVIYWYSIVVCVYTYVICDSDGDSDDYGHGQDYADSNLVK